ncbi:hypothetical protein SDC9_207134 [bioreactor metagenome]|uniref:Uncharacterized protein n=1 Tax=bioreactor metagenome TaxID=1076179 RepID=A0A645JIG2_9ZZZZ
MIPLADRITAHVLRKMLAQVLRHGQEMQDVFFYGDGLVLCLGQLTDHSDAQESALSVRYAEIVRSFF